MKKNGFTIIELLATLVVLALVVGITLVTVNGSGTNAKKKTEEVFIKTLKTAIETSLSSGLNLSEGYYNIPKCTIKKKNNTSNVYEYMGTITFKKVMDSDYSPLSMSDYFNPVNKKTCNENAIIKIYMDDDMVKYYSFDLSTLDCFEYHDEVISVLPQCD